MKWRVRLLQRIAAACGIAIGGAAAPVAPVSAQGVDYRPANAVPAAWQDYAKQLQARLLERLAADDDVARRVQDAMAKRTGDTTSAPTSLGVRAWILPSGKIERIDVDGPNDEAAMNLRVLLARGDVGAPPADILQPLHLRLRLQPNETQH